ncbi:MAG: phosphoribosylformylglycinamidine synthase [Dissulfurispiraceae bacterium]
MPDNLMHMYRVPALFPDKKDVLLKMIREKISPTIKDINTEFCFNIDASRPLTDPEVTALRWLFAETFEPDNFSSESFLTDTPPSNLSPQGITKRNIIEIGPRMTFTTAWSTNAVSICHACGLTKINRIELSRRYEIISDQPTELGSQKLTELLILIHDRMTECPYKEPLKTFQTGIMPQHVKIVPLIERGKVALREINQGIGLGLDDWDIDYYYRFFIEELKRNPTDVECFDLSQSNSEHSRHWFFKGKLVIDGEEIAQSLMQIVKEPYRMNPNNSVIAFNDNSSAITGYKIRAILPENPAIPSPMRQKEVTYHIIFTAETHNFPSGVAPFPGAETGTGGRIRDVHATGRGGLVVAGTAAYCVGNLNIPHYPLPWEEASFIYPATLASPLQIEIEASNGVSSYGNKFGEPVVQGFTRSFGLRLPSGERREWIKPIMFTGGVGQIDARHVEKRMPEKGMAVVKIGGPAYRIGMGGGAASSMIQGENLADLDFNAVQRGDAEMEQKLNRVIRACIEMGDRNPIVSIHDQGAGGNCNVVKEIIYPAGAKVNIRRILLGDTTLSVLEIWGAEYQEQDAALIYPNKLAAFKGLCEREKLPVAVIGEITGDGYIVLFDELDGSTPVTLSLEKILGSMPQKTFHLESIPFTNYPLRFPWNSTENRSSSAPDLPTYAKKYMNEALSRILRLVSVGSKRFLTSKVDRSVTGLIAQQQCVGPMQLTVGDVAVIAQSHSGLTGAAIAIGEQPIKGLISPAAMARMSVGEALTNIVWAKIGALNDIKCSANWMWAPKLPGEGARLYEAAVAMKDIMLELGIAVDGGKDSLSMAAKVVHPSGQPEMVKSPGTLVISAYATCPDITKVITPDLKSPGKSKLLYIDLGQGKNRLGASALAHAYGQVGDDTPDVDHPKLLKNTFHAIQHLIDRELILSGHDRSDGGIITTLLEMAFAGNCGIEIAIGHEQSSDKESIGANFNDVMSLLFSEELGIVIEFVAEAESEIFSVLEYYGVPSQIIGKSLSEKTISIRYEGELILSEDMKALRALWEETSYRLDLLQANPECVAEEKKVIFDRPGPIFSVTFAPQQTPDLIVKRHAKPAVAIIREEGSNGDREMSAAFHHAGFEPWDVTMTDLLHDRITLAQFKGVAFVGGFSYADVLDSAKGWAGVIRFNKRLHEQFVDFYERADTFSLGVCNGCQLMALLGWIPWRGIPDKLQPRFVHNLSGRFESRFVTVTILESPALMLKDMVGSALGIWVAHGEGRAHFPDGALLNKVIRERLAPIRYVDDTRAITEDYPFNPNGSPKGITALCTPDGRHLAVMPHPERTFLKWQWAWMPSDMKTKLVVSPWLKMFQNAREWCESK